ncbi:MAG: alpha-galactosidase [Acidimicrobiaceae bacterium]|nr:alpha-galactosidase [Acidimicrobiaceae bacterium]
MLHALTSARLEFIVDETSGGLEVVHLGSPIGRVDPASFSAPIPEGGIDRLAPISVLAEAAAGWMGKPGLRLHRDGTVIFPRLDPATVTSDGSSLRAVTCDPATQVSVTILATLHDAGVLELVVELRNDGAPLTVDEVLVSVPVPQASEVLQFGGRWSDEFHPTRHSWEWGTFVVENRSGRTSATRFPMLMAGTADFSEQSGKVTAIHLGWSGDGQVRADRLPDGRRILQAGEIFGAGEVVLNTGETHRSAPVFLAHSAAGLNGISDSFHGYVRARPTHVATERPVILNTWEAVYFAHDLNTLSALADRAAAVGVERFVLDDGWFLGRDDDRRALGDWVVDPAKWPAGLDPLIAHVRGLGMEFGLWVEPEMISPDSELFRAHPDWGLVDPHHDPVRARHQLVLDLTNPGAFEHIRQSLCSLLDDHDISYLKWDMNRDLVAPTDSTGRAAGQAQTRAVYRLIDEIKRTHPDIEIESCSSGGGRIDLGILTRTDRVWTSDCNDALDRIRIQRGASYLIPPELMGAHIGPNRAHTTGRTHTVAFRGATAMFGHLGIEWNLLAATDDELAAVERIVSMHKAHRALLHGGRTVRIDVEDEAVSAFVVVAPDQGEAIVSVSQIATSRGLPIGPIRIPGLDLDGTYWLEQLALDERRLGLAKQQPAWLEGVEISGRQLAVAGLPMPILNPETALLLHLQRR